MGRPPPRPTLLLLALAPLLLAAEAAALGRVVLVGVDGGSWNLIDRGIAAGELPHLAALAERGVTARLATVEPVNSPTVWTSIATGRRPEAHGVTAFLVDRRTVRVPTAFERLAARGRRVGLYDYLVTWPPRPLPAGFVIPGWLRRDARVEPADVFAAAGLEPYAYDMDGVRTPDQFVANSRRELREKPGRFVRLLEAHRPDVAAVTFYSCDATGHRFWAHAFPEEFDGEVRAEPRYRAVIGETLRGVDAAVGRIAAALGPEDHLLVVSDHGFHADQRGVRRVWVAQVDDWLARVGLDPERDRFTAAGFGNLAFVVESGPFAERDALYQRLYALAAEAQSADGEPLYDTYRIDVAPRPPEAARPLLEWLRQWAVRRYLEWLGLDLDHPVHGLVFGRPRAEALDAVWPDGAVLVGGEGGPARAVLHAQEFSGTHDPVAIFFAVGPAFAPRPARGDLSVLDVAPLLFHLAGEPIPDDLDGALPAHLLSEAWLASHAPRRIEAAALPALPEPLETGGRPADTPDGPVADDEAVTERLRSLGYVE